tara:strand:- start:110 stop:976 length:867 start_codon:yes stop_codon:yes gene_type:complete
MKILSWDVGIINLAFCLIDFENENKWKILDWGVINLTDRNKIKCNICKKNPTFSQNINNQIKYYCKVHAKKVDQTAPNFDQFFYENISDNKCCCLFKKNPCNKKIKYKSDDNYYCNSHAKSEYKKIQNKYKLKKVSKKSVGSMTIDVLRLKLIKELEDRKNLLEVDSVLIENQPTLRNPKMKAISSTIYDYYLIRGIFDKDKNNSKIKIVKYMSPSNKLKLAEEGDTQKLIKLKGNQAKTYKLTKSLGIKYCLKMIEKNEKWKKFFNNTKKKDDLADCFLQGMYYLCK